MDLDELPVIEQVQQETGGERSHVAEDGTLVIDILVREPCGASTPQEIVVCAPDPQEHRLDTREPLVEEGFKPEIQIAPNAKLLLRAGTDGMTGAASAMIELKIKF